MDEPLRIDVGDAAPAHRVRLWREAVCDRFFGLECDTEVDSFQGRVAGRVLDGGSISRSSISHQTFRRTRSLIGRYPNESLLFLCGVAGTFVVEQGGEESELGAGDVCIVDPMRAYTCSYTSDTAASILVHVPRRSVVDRVGAIDDLAFRAFRGDDPLCKLAFSFVESLALSVGQFTCEAANTLLDQSLDLLALTLSKAKEGAIDPSTHRAAIMLRLKAHISSHLRDGGLTIDSTAQALGLSPRYINAMLAGEGTSFGRYVLAKRLEGAHQDLIDPRRVHTQISELAYAWGFAAPSHFGRAFRKRYGLAPREARGEKALLS